MRKFIYLVTLSALCTLVMTSCLRSGADTIILPELVLVDEVPDTVIPPAIREEFEEYMTLHEGKNPPHIQGQYLLTKYILKYSSDGQFNYGDPFADRKIAFFDQIKGRCRYAGRQGDATGTSSKVYVSGSGNDFTAYYVADVVDDDGETFYTASTLVSGTMTSDGIKDCYYAFIVLDKTDPHNKMMDVNEYRIFFDADGFSENYQWYDESDKAPRRSAPAKEAEENDLFEAIKLNPKKL